MAEPQAKTKSENDCGASSDGKKKRNKAAPKSVLDKIVHAIREQPPSGVGPNGVSRVAISKYLRAEMGYDNPTAFKLALKRGVSKQVLLQTGQSFRVKGDPVPPATESDEDRLTIEDVVEGRLDSGIKAENGDKVTVKYVGKLDDGTQFDAAKSFDFVLGAGEVIKGWDRGLLGMAEGGRRKLVVPSKLGYGKRGCSPDIPPNSTLHFEVTMRKILKGED